jgi:hypothetical protein
MKTRIGILTSGGDCPGLNAVLRGAALAADKLGWEMLGFRDGFEGLLPPGDFTILDRKCTENIMALEALLLEQRIEVILLPRSGPATVLLSRRK